MASGTVPGKHLNNRLPQPECLSLVPSVYCLTCALVEFHFYTLPNLVVKNLHEMYMRQLQP